MIHGVRVMQVPAKSFRIWVNKVQESLTNKTRIRYKLWIGLAAFCAVRYIKDDKDLPGEVFLETKML